MAAAAIRVFMFFTAFPPLGSCRGSVRAGAARAGKQPGKGLAKPAPAARNAPSERRYSGHMATQSPGGRILVVEDEESISAALRRGAAAGGLRGRSSPRTAAGALELAEPSEPDLVMLDLALPDGDGRDVCRELRRRSDVPIVMLTARGTEMDKIVGLELGADDYVVKPFSAARGDLADPRRAAPQRPARRRRRRAKPMRVGELELDPAARIATLRRRASSSSRARSSTCSPS